MELVWHPHHEAYSPLEFLIFSLEDRMKVIAEFKAKEETPEQIAQRYLFIKKFEGEVPEGLNKARDEYWTARVEWMKACDRYNPFRPEYWKARAEWSKAEDELKKARDEWKKARDEWKKARDERDKTWDEYLKAWDELVKALRSPEVMALHAEQCGCNWSPTNRNIFNLTKPERN